MAEKKVHKNIFQCSVPAEPEINWDTEYVSISIVDKVVRTGEGDDDFIIQKVVVEDRQPIAEVVNADAESVGVYNIIKQVMRTGDTSLLPADDGKCQVDLVGAPENLMELKQMGVDAEKAFNGLPKELTKELDMASFVNSLTQEQFDAFVKGIAERAAGKVEEKNE